MEADDADKIISVFHFSKDVSRTHGVPFHFVVKPVSPRMPSRVTICISDRVPISQGERFAETKKRLQARIGVPDKDFAKFRFALIQVATFKQPSYIEDGMFGSYMSARHVRSPPSADDTLYDHKFAADDMLGLDHVDKSGKTRTGSGEKAIVIRG